MIRDTSHQDAVISPVPAQKFKKAETLLDRAGEKFYSIGRIVKGDRKVMYS